jgi:hypothetical protein
VPDNRASAQPAENETSSSTNLLSGQSESRVRDHQPVSTAELAGID